jgi:hypothetical protein
VKLSFKEGLENNFLQIINDTIHNKKWGIFSPAASPSQVKYERKDVFCAGTFVTSKEVEDFSSADIVFSSSVFVMMLCVLF